MKTANQSIELARLLLSEPRRSRAIKVGFLNRILVAKSHIHQIGLRETCGVSQTDWDQLVTEFLQQRGTNPTITQTCSDEASDAFDEAMYLRQKSDAYNIFGSNKLITRDRELLAKIAAIFLRCTYSYQELVSPGSLDDANVVKAAGELWLFLGRHRLRVFNAMHLAKLNELRDSLTRHLEAIHEHEIYTSKLKGTVCNVRRRDLDSMLQICPGRLYLRHGRIGSATRGPESEILGLRPLKFELVTQF